LAVLIAQKNENSICRTVLFCVVVCNSSSNKSFARVCSVDIIEVHVVKSRSADLKCGDHLCKQDQHCIGQIMSIAQKGFDTLSRPKYRIVSCIRKFNLNEGDQLFPVFCDEDEFNRGEAAVVNKAKVQVCAPSVQHDPITMFLQTKIAGLGDADCNEEEKTIANCLLQKLRRNKSLPIG